jgi:hypothetical protein
LIHTPRGGKLPYGTVRAEYLYEPTVRHNTYRYLGIGITTAFDLELRYDDVDGFERETTFDLGYNVNAPFTDLAPGISFGVLDGMNETREGRRFYMAITTKQSASDDLVAGEAMELTMGFMLGSKNAAFVGLSLPFSENVRLIAEHDGFRATGGLELRARPDLAFRLLFRSNETLLGLQVSTRF